MTLACGTPDHPADASDHGDHGHAAEGAERPTVAVTRWTERTELFMEYPVLVAGESGRSAIHVTDLRDFTPLREGEAIVELRAADGHRLEFRGGASRPGIFGVDLAPDRPGAYEMTLRVDAPGVKDVHALGMVTVHAADAVPAAAEEEDDGGISFLKEQQWTLEFGTTPAAVRSLGVSVTVPGSIVPRPGGDATLAAPVPGRIDPASIVPIPGTRVRAGETLVRIAPRSDDLRDAAGLRAALVEAEQDHALAVRQRDRAERLVAARAAPQRRLEEAEAALAAADARLRAAQERQARFESLSQSGKGGGGGLFAVRAPFDGIVAEARFSPGGSVEENEILVRIVDPDRVQVVAAVPEASAARLGSVRGGELLAGDGPPLALAPPLAVGRVLDPASRTTEIRFAFDNAAAQFPVGRSVQVRLFVGDAVSGTAVPETALVDDGGRPVVFVQTGGESFARRPVALGARAGGWVQVLEGIQPGERVVDRGAYLVRLAAMSTQIPAHGHVH